MKKQQAYGFAMLPSSAAAVRLGSGDQHHPYRVIWCEETTGAGEFSARVQRDLLSPTARICMQLPSGDAHYLVVPLPHMAAKLVPAAIRGVVVREKGGEPRDWIVDHSILPSRQAGMRATRDDHGVLFVRDEVMQVHLARALGLGVRPCRALPEYLALDQFYRAHRAADAPAGAWNLVHVGKHARFVCVGEPGGMLFARSLPEDLSHGTELGEYVGRLATEIERSNFFAQQAERSLHVEEVVICGDPEIADPLAQRMSEKSQTAVVRWRPEDLFAWADDAPRPDLILLLAAAAATLGPDRYNLVPADARRAPGGTVRQYATLAAAAGWTAVVPLILVGGLWTASIQRSNLHAVADRERALEARAQESAQSYLHCRALRDREANLRRHAAARLDLEGLLLEVAARTPAAVVYRSLSLTCDGEGRMRLSLAGDSHGHDGVAAHAAFVDFLSQLEASGLLEPVIQPTLLELTADETEAATGVHVSFTLEYLVREAT